jgi:hypothetical protein
VYIEPAIFCRMSRLAVEFDRDGRLLIEVVQVARTRRRDGPHLAASRRQSVGALDIADITELQH